MRLPSFLSPDHWTPERPGARKVVPEVPVDPDRIYPFRVEQFPDAGPRPWLDRPNAESAIRRLLKKGKISREEADLCDRWRTDGYLILPGFFSAGELDEAWATYEAAIEEGKLQPVTDRGQAEEDHLPGRVLNPHFHVPAFEGLLKSPRMVEIISLLLGVRALPFQTIAGHKGSEQLAHSDSIHMTTYPQGYLAANWIAFEDISAECGPLEYYPGSHRLPYAYSKDVGITLDEARGGWKGYYNKYETHVQRSISENGLKAHYFHAGKGDVLLWHANLLHGGSRRKRPETSRKALVCHYFAEGCVCYHDYTGTLSHLHVDRKKNLKGKPIPRKKFDAEAYLEANPDVRAAGVPPYRHYLRHGRAEGRPLRPGPKKS